MHKIELPSYVSELALKRRGRLHQFSAIDLKHTAHVVVDMQNGFIVSGQPAVVPTITGRAWITGTSQFMLDPEDPFPAGFLL